MEFDRLKSIESLLAYNGHQSVVGKQVQLFYEGQRVYSGTLYDANYDQPDRLWKVESGYYPTVYFRTSHVVSIEKVPLGTPGTSYYLTLSELDDATGGYAAARKSSEELAELMKAWEKGERLDELPY